MWNCSGVGRGVAQVQGSGYLRMHLTQLRAAPPACLHGYRPTLVFWWALQSHRVIWLGCKPLPRPACPQGTARL